MYDRDKRDASHLFPVKSIHINIYTCTMHEHKSQQHVNCKLSINVKFILGNGVDLKLFNSLQLRHNCKLKFKGNYT